VPCAAASGRERAVSQLQGGRRYLSASEVGNYTYCPQAWYLQRLGRRPDRDALQRLHAGTRAHQRIGKTTEQLVAVDALRRTVLLMLIVLVAVLLFSGLGLVTLPALR
jgi:hypothetical protein